MKKKVIILIAVLAFVAISVVGCTLKDLNLKVGNVTTDETTEAMKLVD